MSDYAELVRELRQVDMPDAAAAIETLERELERLDVALAMLTRWTEDGVSHQIERSRNGIIAETTWIDAADLDAALKGPKP